MNEREQILARIREALGNSAPPPGMHHNGSDSAPSVSAAQASSSVADRAREWLPQVGRSFEDRLALFQKNAADLRAEFRLLNSLEEMRGVLLALRDAEGWKKIATHSGELTDFVCGNLGLAVCRTEAAYATVDLESCNVGITECDALVAQTGSVLVTSRSAGGRALSVLPPHHVVLVRRAQLLADLPEAFALLKNKYALNYPSFISFITGPSRTGDIERILVLGAHGPRKLTILCA